MNTTLRSQTTVLITGAAGNLGSLLAHHLKDASPLHLMIHNKDVPDELKSGKNIRIFKADLSEKKTLYPALEDVDVIVHFAGVLFKHNPEKFLHTTNVSYFHNLLDVAAQQKVKRVILISFPHVEGESTPEKPAKGHLDGKPESVHAQTRLQEEKLLFDLCQKNNIEAVSLRVGMVYGKGILMVDAAQWFARHCLLGVWKKPTFIHLISKDDFCDATAAAIYKENITGVYHIGDDGIQTLQEFLDEITVYCGNKKPWRMPAGLIFSAAQIFEWTSMLFNVKSPLTKDFIRIGMVSYYGDTARMRNELLPELKYKTFRDGIKTFR